MGARAELQDWLRVDFDESTRNELAALLQESSEEALQALLAPPMAFGTAGLRAPLGPGPARMNALTVLRATWALAQFLRQFEAPLQVIIGFDARHRAEEFAGLATRLLRAQGVTVLLAPTCVPTPLIAFAARRVGAQAALVFTASHNPKQDSGMKVYDGQGMQIASPWDRDIQRGIDEAPFEFSLEPRANCNAREFAEFEEAYLSYLAQLARSYPIALPKSEQPRSVLAFAYSPLHGVAGPLMLRLVQRLNCERESSERELSLCPVEAQMQPDPEFSTLEFPNPEQPGTLAQLENLMRAEQLDLGIAQDPDGDRFVALLRCGGSDEGLEADISLVDGSEEGFAAGGEGAQASILQLSGDGIGLLMAELILASQREEKDVNAAPQAVVSTAVSSPLLKSIAEAYGAEHRICLTGFKWIARAAQAQPPAHFGYEEALGYLFSLPGPSGPELLVADKDGLAAAALFLSWARQVGVASLLHFYWDQQERWGEHVSVQQTLALKRPFASKALKLLQQLLRQRLQEVSGLRDLSEGAATRPDYFGKQDLLLFSWGEVPECRVAIRPSGTEPKLKIYLHLRHPPMAQPGRGALHQRLARRKAHLEEAHRRCAVLAELIEELLASLADG